MKSLRVSMLTWSREGVGSALGAAVDRRDAEGERVPLDVGEPGAAHSRGQIFLDRKIGDRSRKIRVRGAMTAHERADARQNVMEVQVIHRANDRRARRRELENHEARAGREHAMDLAQPAIEIGDVANAERHDRARRAVVGQREVERVGDDRRHDRRRRLFPTPARSIGSAKSAPTTRPAKPGRRASSRRDVERAGAQVDVGAAWARAPNRAPRCARRRHALSMLKLRR